MRIAWSAPELRECCTTAHRLSAAAGIQALVARDLVAAVVHASDFGDLIALRSIRMTPNGPGIILSLEEVHMYTRLLYPAGNVRVVRLKDPLSAYASTQGLVIDDLAVGTQSVTRRAG